MNITLSGVHYQNKLPVAYSNVQLACIYWYSILHAGVTEVRCTVTASCERTNTRGISLECHVSFIIAIKLLYAFLHIVFITPTLW